jgi:membrane associated rhomboid family serine protease
VKSEDAAESDQGGSIELAEDPTPIELTWRAKGPGFVLCGVIVVAWLLHLPQGMVMLDWAISADQLRAGEYRNVVLHMFAHAGVMHLVMNSAVLVSIAGLIQYRMGADPAGWLRFLAFYFLAGLAGMALYLAFHPYSPVPMLGASGAIYGLVGFLVRWPPTEAEPGPLLSAQTRTGLVDFVKDNVLLIVLLTLPALLSGRGGGVAWEGHLGGFLFGLLAAPWFGKRGDLSPQA